MRQFASYRILLLTVLIAVSHVALAVHATAHSGPELGQCALCISHAKAGSATLQTTFISDPYIRASIDLSTLEPRVIRQLANKPYQTRAPPIVS